MRGNSGGRLTSRQFLLPPHSHSSSRARLSHQLTSHPPVQVEKVVAEKEVMVRVGDEEVLETRVVKVGVVTRGASRKQSEGLRMAPAVKANRVKTVVEVEEEEEEEEEVVVAGMRRTVLQ